MFSAHPVQDLLHCLYFCPKAFDVWIASDPSFKAEGIYDHLATKWLDTMHKNGPDALKKEVIMCWGVWKARNQAIFNQISASSFQTITYCAQYFANFYDSLLSSHYQVVHSQVFSSSSANVLTHRSLITFISTLMVSGWDRRIMSDCQQLNYC